MQALPKQSDDMHEPCECVCGDRWVWLATRMQRIVFWSLAGTVHSFASKAEDK
jgi:hypothetical protein